MLPGLQCEQVRPQGVIGQAGAGDRIGIGQPVHKPGRQPLIGGQGQQPRALFLRFLSVAPLRFLRFCDSLGCRGAENRSNRRNRSGSGFRITQQACE
ncbi:hypothetical protein CR938_00590 [Pseudoxanthomonas taiwanensis]|uniref:Uncharacterized protein n=1 Tax=Pseudoxanthomonas taiwanensis TaxID=176598 RepID=A0A921TJD6_9GAMM|nr:hypothetical protein CR938_00590 [Pseudoxanthomonas taiwanensis]